MTMDNKKRLRIRTLTDLRRNTKTKLDFNYTNQSFTTLSLCKYRHYLRIIKTFNAKIEISFTNWIILFK